MKQFVSLICAACLVTSSFAQQASLLVAINKTTSLIFPHAIKHVDRGTKDILVEPVKESDNILLVKAASKDFLPTNLSVVTDDGSVYSFAVSYGEPAEWVYRLPPQLQASIATYANSILDNPKTLVGIRDASWNIITRVIGIYIKNDVIYYQLDLTNGSAIDYDINYLRFYVRDKKKAKRTASQDLEIVPLYIAGNISHVRAGDHHCIVVALDKFTIPDAKYLAIEIGEKNGGRNLLMKVSNRKIIKALPLSDFK
jgi:conjugative transposon TraN protein